MPVNRIALAATDDSTLAEHLARASTFVIIDLNAGAPGERTVRRRGDGVCGNHATFVELLAGCDAVICGGIGQGALDSLAAAGIETVVAPKSTGATLDAVLKSWLEGTLELSTDRVCLCRH
jgi:predicted Fe-Mo cluster-binding NifX family protein